MGSVQEGGNFDQEMHQEEEVHQMMGDGGVGDNLKHQPRDWFVDLISAAVEKDTHLLAEKIALNHDILTEEG